MSFFFAITTVLECLLGASISDSSYLFQLLGAVEPSYNVLSLSYAVTGRLNDKSSHCIIVSPPPPSLSLSNLSDRIAHTTRTDFGPRSPSSPGSANAERPLPWGLSVVHSLAEIVKVLVHTAAIPDPILSPSKLEKILIEALKYQVERDRVHVQIVLLYTRANKHLTFLSPFQIHMRDWIHASSTLRSLFELVQWSAFARDVQPTASKTASGDRSVSSALAPPKTQVNYESEMREQSRAKRE